MKLVVRINQGLAGVTGETPSPVFTAAQARRRKAGDLTIAIEGKGQTKEEAVADLARALVMAGEISYRERKPTVRKSKAVPPAETVGGNS